MQEKIAEVMKMKKKIFKTTAIILFVVLICMQIGSFYRSTEQQHKINQEFMNSYINLTLTLLNKTELHDAKTLHKLDIENTKYSHTMTKLYPYISYYKDGNVSAIITTLNYVSGCDAVYEIKFSKELYDILKEFGQHLWEDTCTEEIAKSTWEELEKTVDFDKVKPTKSYVVEN